MSEEVKTETTVEVPEYQKDYAYVILKQELEIVEKQISEQINNVVFAEGDKQKVDELTGKREDLEDAMNDIEKAYRLKYELIEHEDTIAQKKREHELIELDNNHALCEKEYAVEMAKLERTLRMYENEELPVCGLAMTNDHELEVLKQKQEEENIKLERLKTKATCIFFSIGVVALCTCGALVHIFGK